MQHFNSSNTSILQHLNSSTLKFFNILILQHLTTIWPEGHTSIWCTCSTTMQWWDPSNLSRHTTYSVVHSENLTRQNISLHCSQKPFWIQSFGRSHLRTLLRIWNILKSSLSPTNLPFSPTTSEDLTPRWRTGSSWWGFWWIPSILKPICLSRIQLLDGGRGQSWQGSWWPIFMKFGIWTLYYV